MQSSSLLCQWVLSFLLISFLHGRAITACGFFANQSFGLQSVGTDTMTGGVMNVNTQIHLANVRSNSPIEPPKNLRMISFHPTLKWSSSTRGMKWRAHGREYVLDQSRAYLGTVCLDLSYAYTMQTLRRDPSSPFRKPHTCEDK